VVIRFVAQFERAALSIGVDMAHGDKIVLRVERTPFGHSERSVCSGLTDRTPDGENPYAPPSMVTLPLENKMTVDALDRGSNQCAGVPWARELRPACPWGPLSVPSVGYCFAVRHLSQEFLHLLQLLHRLDPLLVIKLFLGTDVLHEL